MVQLQPFPARSPSASTERSAPRKGGVKDDPMAPVSTLAPGRTAPHGQRAAGGLEDLHPVFIKGGLIWTGDSHCRQGNGEVSLTALERRTRRS